MGAHAPRRARVADALARLAHARGRGGVPRQRAVHPPRRVRPLQRLPQDDARPRREERRGAHLQRVRWSVERVGRPPGARRLRRGGRHADARGVRGLALSEPMGLARSHAGRRLAAARGDRRVPAPLLREHRSRSENLRRPLLVPALSERRHRRPLPTRRHPVRIAGRAGRRAHRARAERARRHPHRARRDRDHAVVRSPGAERRHPQRGASHGGAQPARRDRPREHSGADHRLEHRRDVDQLLRAGGFSARRSGSASSSARARTGSTSR